MPGGQLQRPVDTLYELVEGVDQKVSTLDVKLDRRLASSAAS